jgi:hypothetical protein
VVGGSACGSKYSIIARSAPLPSTTANNEASSLARENVECRVGKRERRRTERKEEAQLVILFPANRRRKRIFRPRRFLPTFGPIGPRAFLPRPTLVSGAPASDNPDPERPLTYGPGRIVEESRKLPPNATCRAQVPGGSPRPRRGSPPAHCQRARPSSLFSFRSFPASWKRFVSPGL